ncbi:transposase [Litoribacterium kuwaitense]|uniref:transposase n=1 Tax=Litoribacterium kuwaitense TaxID=1398745 RepID=UPI0035E438FC
MDDFAFKRRHTYGVIICDAVSSKPIDLLPDREVKTLKSWFSQHLNIQHISRDRYARFREVIDEIIPQSIQITSVALKTHLIMINSE